MGGLMFSGLSASNRVGAGDLITILKSLSVAPNKRATVHSTEAVGADVFFDRRSARNALGLLHTAVTNFYDILNGLVDSGGYVRGTGMADIINGEAKWASLANTGASEIKPAAALLLLGARVMDMIKLCYFDTGTDYAIGELDLVGSFSGLYTSMMFFPLDSSTAIAASTLDNTTNNPDAGTQLTRILVPNQIVKTTYNFQPNDAFSQYFDLTYSPDSGDDFEPVRVGVHFEHVADDSSYTLWHRAIIAD